MDLSDAADGGANDLGSPGPSKPDSLLARIAFAVGGVGLIGATLSDAIAVTGRHAGFNLLGSIELVQAAVVLLATSAMLIATITDNHASVHMLTSRLSTKRARMMARVAAFVSGVTFLVILAGSLWISAEMWNAHEQSELLHIPFRWLRMVWLIAALLIAWQFFKRAFKSASRDGGKL
ncbi:MAG: TRAP transporter small permease subunit [Novosphingobium sp.]